MAGNVTTPQGIDAAMQPLVEAMNRIPYIETFSCCQGHPEESAVRQYGYAVANVIFEIKNEPENLIAWFSLAQEILRQRKKADVAQEFAFIIEKKYNLNEKQNLGWQWEIKIQATGKNAQDCRKGLDEGLSFLREIFVKEAENGKGNRNS